MSERTDLKRRGLLGAAGVGLLAMPAIVTRRAYAETETDRPASQGPVELDAKQLRLGSFKIVVVSDGASIQPRPWETYGLDQPQDSVRSLLDQNFLPLDRFAVSYAPAIIDTGSDIVLTDTGFGEATRASGSGRLLAGLTAAGYAPEQVTIVALSHLHRDHIGGLMEGGRPTFPNARYVVNQVEYDFWVSSERVGTPAEENHKMVLANVVPLAPKMTFLKDGQDVVPGMTAMLAAGHSPGHMVFHLESQDKRLMMISDSVVHYVLSLQRPDWQVRFDMDKPAAAETRKRVLDMIATDRLPFFGYHMPHPSVGFLDRRDTGYYFVPETYQFDI